MNIMERFEESRRSEITWTVSQIQYSIVGGSELFHVNQSGWMTVLKELKRGDYPLEISAVDGGGKESIHTVSKYLLSSQ